MRTQDQGHGVSVKCPECRTRIVQNVDEIYVIPGLSTNIYDPASHKSAAKFKTRTVEYELAGTDYETESEHEAQKALSSLNPGDKVHLVSEGEVIIVKSADCRIGHLSDKDADEILDFLAYHPAAEIVRIIKGRLLGCVIRVFVPIIESEDRY
jgi:hypothetical protein